MIDNDYLAICAQLFQRRLVVASNTDSSGRSNIEGQRAMYAQCIIYHTAFQQGRPTKLIKAYPTMITSQYEFGSVNVC